MPSLIPLANLAHFQGIDRLIPFYLKDLTYHEPPVDFHQESSVT